MTQTLLPSPLQAESPQLILSNISWEMYEKLLEIFAEYPAIRLTYYH